MFLMNEIPMTDRLADKAIRADAKILVVDDNENNSLVLTDILAAADYEVFVAATGRKALQIAKEQQPDCILLDIMLPDIDGYDVCRQIKSDSNLASIQIILVSALSDSDEIIVGLDMGADDYIAKPFNSNIVKARVRSALRTKEALDDLAEANKQLHDSNQFLDQKTEKMEELCRTARQFVENTSHEFRTPLAVIKEFNSILKDQLAGPINDEQQDYLTVIASRVDDLACMVDDMLDISKLEAGQLVVRRKSCQIQAIVERSLKLLQRRADAEKIQIEVSLQDDLPDVFCDAEKIGRVLINLAVNAIKFTPQQGKIKIEATPSEDRSFVTISISDNGPGINQTDLQRIFQRFEQVGGNLRTTEKGFGLGLNIATELVSLNRGRISVTSKLGEGSTFSFTVPISSPRNILQSYFLLAAQTQEQPEYFSLITSSVSAEADPVLISELNELFQSELRNSDLVVEVSPGKWVLLLPATAEEAENVMQRLVEARERNNCQRLLEPLPAFQLEIKDHWQTPISNEEIEIRFNKAIEDLECFSA